MPILTTEQTRISWLLAEHLEGMRRPCREPFPFPHPDTCMCHGRGWWPVELTAEGLIDEGRLHRAIEAVPYLRVQYWGAWVVYRLIADGPARSGQTPDLAVAFLKAVGKWPE